MVNMTFADTTNNLYDVVKGVNDVSNGTPFIIILALIFLATYSMFKNYETTIAFGGASFVTSILGGLAWFMGLIAWYIAIIPLVMLVASMILWTTRS